MRSIYSISMVKNEADIIESFVRYHLNLFDGMVILDNGSTDNTVPILDKLISEGLPVILRHDNSMDYSQAEKTTKLMYSTFTEYEPDLILPLDADEFVISPNSHEHPRNILEQIDLNKVYYNRMREYVPSGKDDPNELFIPKRIVHTWGDEGEDWYKVAVTQEIASRFLPTLTMGNHDLQFHGDTGRWIGKEVFAELRLAHYSIRSIEQAKSKILVGWLNSLARHNRKIGEGAGWEGWFNILKHKDKLSANDRDELILHLFGGFPTGAYPIDLSFCKSIQMKYTKADEVNAVKNLLEYCETLAAAYANLKRD